MALPRGQDVAEVADCCGGAGGKRRQQLAERLRPSSRTPAKPRRSDGGQRSDLAPTGSTGASPATGGGCGPNRLGERDDQIGIASQRLRSRNAERLDAARIVAQARGIDQAHLGRRPNPA